MNLLAPTVLRRGNMRLLLLISALLFANTAIAGEQAMARYGSVVEYKEDKTIQYPDFKIIYQGSEHVDSPVFKPGFTFKHFMVSAPEGIRKISWSSGTGVIEETPFSAAGKTFYLDLAPRKNGRFINSGKQDMIIHDEPEYRSYSK